MDTSIWIALGSVATAVIAGFNIYLLIKLWSEKPKLSVDFSMDEPFCRTTMSTIFDKFTRADQSDDVAGTHWFRIRISNSGRSVANRCIGKSIEIWNCNEGKAIDQFDPTQLLWVSTSWKEVPFRDISLKRQEYEYLDVFATQQGDEKVYICGDQFPWAKYEQRGVRNTLKPGSYIMHIRIYGDNVAPETKYVGIIWGGQNFKDISVAIHDTFRNAKAWIDRKKQSD
ncbi:MAG: hypothetical protein HY530_02900 [Chloroflexi bacterium]|nr:hypothetical protein [Chloroflexota bacterium]